MGSNDSDRNIGQLLMNDLLTVPVIPERLRPSVYGEQEVVATSYAPATQPAVGEGYPLMITITVLVLLFARKVKGIVSVG